jgi:adenylate cyclase
VERLIELKILDPPDDGGFSDGDMFRSRLMRSAEQAGVPLDGVAKAIEAGRFTLAFLDLPHFRWSALSEKSLAQLEAESGIALDDLVAFEAAQGAERPTPDDRVRLDTIEAVPLVRLAVDAGIDPTIISRVMRAYVESMRRIAEAECYAYHHYVELPLLRAGLGHKEMAEMANALVAQMTPLQESMILGIYRRQQELVWTADIIEHMESSLEELGVYVRPERPPAIVFLDLAGYTRLTEERGDQAAAELAGRLGDLVQGFARSHGGRPVKWLGDGVLLYFPDPAQAASAAVAMVRDVPGCGLPAAHAGVAAGPVIAQDGEYYGRTVNLAARLASHARAGETLVDDEVVRSARTQVRFSDLGSVELKGIPRRVRVHQAMSE